MKKVAADAVDLISELPQGIIETILNKLPIRDAVTTSILSTRWRYKWTTLLTHLVFNDRCVDPEIEDELTDELTDELKERLVNFITRFLFLHNGPIHKFKLSTSYSHHLSDINQWLLYVSRKDLQRLVLELGVYGQSFITPSCIFSCHKLTNLELVRCKLKLPPNFKGFLRLKRLKLVESSISSDDMESLISTSPLLESLTLDLHETMELIVRAPNLKYLVLDGDFKNLCIAYAPLLVSISTCMFIDLDDNFVKSSTCNFDKFLGGVPNLERLTGQKFFTKYLSIGNPNGWKPITYHHLKFIELHEVSFDDVAEVLVVLLLIDSSPNLQELQISGISNTITQAATTGILDTVSYTFPNLKTVKVADVAAESFEMKFIEYLLKCSAGLETMSITPHPSVPVKDMLIDLVSFPRASPHAKIIFNQNRFPMYVECLRT